MTGHTQAPETATPQVPWPDLPDEELLKLRARDLKLRIEGSDVEPFVQKLYDELEAHGIPFKPRCYLATEWLCPDKVPMIGIPFCLAHPRLKKLERTMMLEVEGGTEKECMQLLRHEAGHAINYAYQLYRRSRWRELFGPFSMPYDVQSYYPRPFSRKYVVHLRDHYAQAHPDEDFAETFAVWLTPGCDWRRRYARWGALRKLEYVNHLMSDLREKPPAVSGGTALWSVSTTRATLKTYYERKRKAFADGYPGFYDNDLLMLFTTHAAEDRLPAGAFLRRHRRAFAAAAARWARVSQYAVDQRVRKLARRADELGLYVRGSEQEALTPVSAYFTALVCDLRTRSAPEHNRIRV